jgi:hypothetical protein
LRSEAFVSIQIAVLKILSSHGSGRASLASLNRDIAILAASGAEWSARIRRLAARVSAVDIFGQGYVVRDDDGWEITPAGRVFLAALEAVTQDNLQPDDPPAVSADNSGQDRGGLIVVGHRFRNRIHRPGMPVRKAGAKVGALSRGL